MYIADIGQAAFEEINLGANGANFGWDLREGSQGAVLAGAVDPVAAYPHGGSFISGATTGSRAITVGDVVRNSEISALNGQLILGDFPNGVIYTLDVDNDPLDGGSDGLTELLLVDENGQTVRLLDLIRQQPGKATLNRTDMRFSYGLDGEVFVLNKRDNIIRRLAPVAIPEPSGMIVLAIGIVALH